MRQEAMEKHMGAVFGNSDYDLFSKTADPGFDPDKNLGDDDEFDMKNADRWREKLPNGGTHKRNRKNVSKHRRKCQSRKKPLRKRKCGFSPHIRQK
jgi:hypothetical protein